ncbi:A disintegrin and metallo ase with thrombospondin motifs 6 [Paramuricea clavata]|uniref:A disintegrin and metallo ase with thrombospondin motifs 6 n=1 Tax=Paramuricea clavata TaxID=317549 RepID=A0A6S7HBG0_PARCT|nr:A disintegrin and metallo ase with thrombospondin motifs 6 [Paramuricea clavata]
MDGDKSDIVVRVLSYVKNAPKAQKLRQITKWADINNVADDNNPNHADQTVLFTTHNNGGMATLGVVCRRYDASAMVSLSGLSSSFVTAHETAHSLGYGHDGQKYSANCPNGAGVMSTYLPAGQAAFVWSKCSRKYATEFLKSKRSRCLDNMPTVRGPTQSPLLRAKLPGEVFNADKQCEMIFGAGRTQCTTKKWCIHGECVDDGSPVIDGNWGEWSDYTPCTRSCGGGVRHRIRKCNNPSPSNGGMKCAGSSVGQHRICNVKACPRGTASYRRFQCMAVGYSWSYYISKQACSLWCIRNWKIFYHGNVKDGTPCTIDPSNHDVCVGGICQSVGCDTIFHSDRENDRCGVCDGSGSTCTKRKIYYKKNFWKFGTSRPFSMVVLKKGSSNIFVKKTGATWNWIGVRNMDGKYLISLPTYSKTVYKAGTKISYIHKSSKFKDEIIIPGPIQENLELVFVRIYEANRGVHISFFDPVNNTETPPPSLFSWKEYEWSKCSRNCGGGFRKRKVKCYRKDDMSIVGKRFCSSTLKPNEKKFCYTSCPAEWFITHWKPCSKRCGRGIQTRKIICRRKKMDSWIVEDDSACVKQRPVVPVLARHCNEIMCPPEYIPLAWSECSTSCDEGVSTRKLKCQIVNKKGISKYVPMRVCEQNGSPEPQTTRRCNHDIPCKDKALNYVWIGCFLDSKYPTSRLLPVVLENLRRKIDWYNPSATIDECAILASKKGKEYFAIQYYGECRTYKDGNRLDYTTLGISHNFWAGLGGSWTNCVYKFQ